MSLSSMTCWPSRARKKDQKANPKKLAKSGIPLSSGQTAPVLPRPPPWALHMWSTRGTIESQSALSLSRTLSDLALDRAMASLYSRMKVVGVSLEVRKKPRDRKGAGSGLLHSSSSRRSPTECCSCDPIPREAPGCAGEEALLGQGGAQPHEAQEGLQGAAQPVESQTASRAQPPTATGAPTPTPTGAGAAQQQTCSRCSLPLPSETSHGPPGASDIAEDALSEAETEDGEEHRSEGWAQFEEYVSVKLVAVPGVTVDDVASVSLAEQGEHRRVPSSLAIAHVRVRLLLPACSCHPVPLCSIFPSVARPGIRNCVSNHHVLQPLSVVLRHSPSTTAAPTTSQSPNLDDTSERSDWIMFLAS